VPSSLTSVTKSGPALFLLGGIELRGLAVDDADRLLPQSKAVALLAYLALSPSGRYQRRDRLVGLLWPELDQAHARSALRKTVHLVRSAIGGGAFAARGDEELALAPGALWCDVVELHACGNSGLLGRVLDLYRGDLMPGFHLPECGEFDMWLEDQRASALECVVASAWALAQDLEVSSRLTDAARLARQVARFAWNDERVLRRALHMLDRLGDRAGALRLFENFARRLRKEFDAEPSPETTALAATLRIASTSNR
jgi:serine/threonine-protein kinase